MSLKSKARDVAYSYFDTYCGTGHVMFSSELVNNIISLVEPFSKDMPLYNVMSSHNVMKEVMEGIFEGIAEAECMYKAGVPHKASPLDKIKTLCLEKLEQMRNCGG